MKMVKSSWLGARTDKPTFDKVTEYIKAADQIDGMGDLLRKAVLEYIANHPIKSTQEV